MPELGKYAMEVLGAYGISLVMLGGLLALTLYRGRRARAALKQVEAEVQRNGKV